MCFTLFIVLVNSTVWGNSKDFSSALQELFLFISSFRFPFALAVRKRKKPLGAFNFYLFIYFTVSSHSIPEIFRTWYNKLGLQVRYTEKEKNQAAIKLLWRQNCFLCSRSTIYKYNKGAVEFSEKGVFTYVSELVVKIYL